MSNVIHLKVPSRWQPQSARHGALIASFAQHRRFGDDVFWLKENAELLNILECTEAELDDNALEPHQGFYAQVEKRLGFFPQYYRFLLSICLDLEDLGMPGNKGEALAHWVAREGLAHAEMSDLQRAEARRLVLRRGMDPLPEDSGLTERLHCFVDRSETFAMPNKKAAYELTHIVFYLSEYGRRDPQLSKSALRSLEYAGILAYLDQNADLLAEISIALRYGGQTPPERWEDWLQGQIEGFVIETGASAVTGDDYHDYFVANWAMATAERESFTRQASTECMSFHRPDPITAPLRTMSETLFELADRRSGDWQTMRPLVEQSLSEDGFDILSEAQASTANFDAFFAGFARTSLSGVAL